jgi:hypothetical protein
MDPYLSCEIARFHQAEIRGQAAQVRLAREALASRRRPRRLTLSKFRSPIPVTINVRGLRPA